MPKTCVGIDIGACELKLAVCTGGELRRVEVAEMPDNLVRDGRLVSPEAMAEFLKKVAKDAKIGTRACGVILPSSVAFARTMSMPAMTHEHLKLNLPYEFRDFITQEKDKYFYDYAVLSREDGEDGEPKQFELIAAATLKQTIAEYASLCRRAGFRLVTAVTEELAYMNLLRAHIARAGDGAGEREFGFIDLGHTATRLHIYAGVKHQATRAIEYGAQLLDLAIAEQFSVDEHIARTYKHANNNGELQSAVCQNIYSTIAVEVMRAINFYRFNSPDSNLEDIYICGGGSRIEPLIRQLQNELPMRLHPITELLPESARLFDGVALCQTAIGVVSQ